MTTNQPTTSMRGGRLRINAHPSPTAGLWEHRGASEMEDGMSDERAAADRATVAQLNRDALSKVQEETGVALPAGTYSQWRPTKRVTGEIDGLGRATIVATDGVLGVFVDGAVKVGHVHRFRWSDGESEKVGAPAALHSVPGSGSSAARPSRKVKKPKVKSAKARFMEELLA